MTLLAALVAPLLLADLANDPDRPQLCFSAPVGWINDPNGLSWYKGEWHLFFQHNPNGTKWAPPSWGHAVSKDLVRWRSLGEAIEAKDGGAAWSGCAVVDHDGVAGFGKDVQLLYYTWVTPQKHEQRLAYSHDGRTYVPYAGNPLVEQDPKATTPQDDRDPWVFWHAAAGKWVMLLYGSDCPNGKRRPFFFVRHSDDLLRWTEVNRLYGLRDECPVMSEFAVAGEATRKWVFLSAPPVWYVGAFDGTVLTVESQGEGYCGWKRQWYAFQLFANAPEDRKVGLGWAKQHTPPGSRRAFNQALTPALEFRLVRTADGLKLARLPVREYETLRAGPARPAGAFEGELADVNLSVTVAADGRFEMSLRGVPLVYDAPAQTLRVGSETAAWPLADGRLALRILVDRLGVTAFDAMGLRILPDVNAKPDAACRAIGVTLARGCADLACDIYPLRSIYESDETTKGELK